MARVKWRTSLLLFAGKAWLAEYQAEIDDRRAGFRLSQQHVLYEVYDLSFTDMQVGPIKVQDHPGPQGYAAGYGNPIQTLQKENIPECLSLSWISAEYLFSCVG